MKLLIAAPYYAPSVGGVEVYVKSLIKQLKTSHQIVLVTTQLPGTKAYEVKNGMTIYRLKPWFKASNTPINPLWRWHLRHIIKKERPDVVNAHTPVPFLADMAQRASGRVPFVLTYHNDLAKDGTLTNAIAKLYYALLGNRTLKGSSAIVATSNFYADNSPYLAKHKTKLHIVSPGVDMTLFNTEVDKTWLQKRYSGKRIILFVGTMDKTHDHKGLDVLIKAVAHTKQQNMQIVAVGRGDNIAHYKKIANDVGVAIAFPGQVPIEELPYYFAGAHMLVLPSTNDSEGFGMVLLEAQACGTPVIGTKAGGVPFVIEDGKTGLLVQPNAVASLAEAIKAVVSNPSMAQQLAQTACAHIEQKFTWHIQVAKMERLLQTITRPYIVQVTPSYPPRVGGMEQRIQDLATRLAADDYQVEVLTSDQGSYIHTEVSDNLTVRYLRSVELAYTPIIPGLIPALFRIPKHSIVHVHIAQAFTPEIVASICRLRNIPYVAHVRLDTPPSSLLGRVILEPYKKLCLKPVLRLASWVIVLTPDYIKLLHKKYGLDKTRMSVIPNATTFSVRKKARAAVHKPARLLFVGRLASQKDPLLLLRACKILVNQQIDFQLTMVGEGDMRAEIEHTIKTLDLQNYVTLAGVQTGQVLEQSYELADIMILSSKAESFGTVLIEAMAKALPIVATHIPAVQNVVQHGRNGLLTVQAPEAMAQAIAKCIEDTSFYTTCSANNLQDVQSYNWTEIVSLTKEVYKKLQ